MNSGMNHDGCSQGKEHLAPLKDKRSARPVPLVLRSNSETNGIQKIEAYLSHDGMNPAHVNH